MAFEPDPNAQLAVLDELTVDGEPDPLLAEWDQFSSLQIKEKAAPDWHGRWEKAFDPEEARDWHGRWAGSSGIGSKLQVSSMGKRYGSWSPEQHAQVQRAVDQAIERSPELLSGDHPLRSVHYTSTPLSKEPPVPGASRRAREELAGWAMRAWAITENTVDEPDKPLQIVMNDAEPFERAGLLTDAAGASVEGIATHELGHAWFMSQGVGYYQARALLKEQGLTPERVGEKLKSIVAASDGHEALAEMYAAKYMPGHSLPADLDKAFTAIEARTRSGEGAKL